MKRQKEEDVRETRDVGQCARCESVCNVKESSKCLTLVKVYSSGDLLFLLLRTGFVFLLRDIVLVAPRKRRHWRSLPVRQQGAEAPLPGLRLLWQEPVEEGRWVPWPRRCRPQGVGHGRGNVVYLLLDREHAIGAGGGRERKYYLLVVRSRQNVKTGFDRSLAKRSNVVIKYATMVCPSVSAARQ